MELHTLYRAMAMTQTHEQAVCGVSARLQAARQGLSPDEQAVVATDHQRLRQAFEEAAPVVVNERFVPVDRLGVEELSAEVLSDSLVPKADPEDGELLWSASQTLHRHASARGATRARPDQDPRRVKGLDRGPIGAVRAQDLYPSAELLEQLREVKSEGVTVVEDHNHGSQDAFRALWCKVQAKKRGWRDSYLAQVQSWNKVPG